MPDGGQSSNTVGLRLAGHGIDRLPRAFACTMPNTHLSHSSSQALKARPPKRPKSRIGGGSLPKSATVLLLVDFINPLDFPGAEDLAPGALAAAQATTRLKRRLERDGVTCIYANDNYGVWRSEFRDILAMCQQRPGVAGDIARLLAPADADLAILKPRHSAFFGTPLDLMLTQMQTKTLVIVGLAADICVQLTAMDASLRGYRLWVPFDCTAAESEAALSSSREYLKRVLHADTRRSTERRRL